MKPTKKVNLKSSDPINFQGLKFGEDRCKNYWEYCQSSCEQFCGHISGYTDMSHFQFDQGGAYVHDQPPMN